MRKGIKGDRLKVLTDEEISDIKLAVLRLLKDQGIRMRHERALEILEEMGCEVNHDKQVVFIPEYIVDESIAKSPKSIRLCGRDKDQDMVLEGSKVFFGNGVGVSHVYDLETERRRKADPSDISDAVKLLDALPNLDYVAGFFSPVQFNPKSRGLHEQYAVMSETTKHCCILGYHGERQTRDQVKITECIAGGKEEMRRRPLVTMYCNPPSPLFYSSEIVEQMIVWPEAGLPIICGTAPSLGATSPITLAGWLAQGFAECLAGVVLIQSMYPDAPVMIGPIPAQMDMKTTRHTWASVEATLQNIASPQIARSFGLPYFGMGGLTDSNALDGQAMSEAAISLFLGSLSGVNVIHDVGEMGGGDTASLELTVVCDEFIKMLKRISRGIDVDEEKLAIDVISQVGYEGNFLSSKHTLTHLKDLMVPELIDHSMRKDWEKKGKKRLQDRAREKAKRILREHEVERLPKDVEKEINCILQGAEKRESK